MSFIKDLMAWKSRSERKSSDEPDMSATDRSEDLVAEWEAESWDDSWREGDGGVLDDPAEAGRNHTGDLGGADVDELIARLSERSARRDALNDAADDPDDGDGHPDTAHEASSHRMKISTRPLAHHPIETPRAAPVPASAEDLVPHAPEVVEMTGTARPSSTAPGLPREALAALDPAFAAEDRRAKRRKGASRSPVVEDTQDAGPAQAALLDALPADALAQPVANPDLAEGIETDLDHARPTAAEAPLSTPSARSMAAALAGQRRVSREQKVVLDNVARTEASPPVGAGPLERPAQAGAAVPPAAPAGNAAPPRTTAPEPARQPVATARTAAPDEDAASLRMTAEARPAAPARGQAVGQNPVQGPAPGRGQAAGQPIGKGSGQVQPGAFGAAAAGTSAGSGRPAIHAGLPGGRLPHQARAPEPATPASRPPPPEARRAPPPEAVPEEVRAPEPRPEVRPSGRAKTRLLGFHNPAAAIADPFDQAAASTGARPTEFPTGWLIITSGPGRGACFTLTEGVSTIGRASDQAVSLDFGDQAISRQGHAAVAFDEEVGRFYLGHGGKLNLVRLNDKPLLTTEELATGDRIRIGETTLQFVAFCGPDFRWSEPAAEVGGHAGRDAAKA